jgi:DNA end-binding protein Ku
VFRPEFVRAGGTGALLALGGPAVARSIWSGVITFGMVSIPVKLYPATQDKDVSFHLLHQPDHSRIRFKRFCAAEDKEVPPEELVRAYEVSEDQYVEITDEDLEELPLPAKHTIELYPPTGRLAARCGGQRA